MSYPPYPGQAPYPPQQQPIAPYPNSYGAPAPPPCAAPSQSGGYYPGPQQQQQQQLPYPTTAGGFSPYPAQQQQQQPNTAGFYNPAPYPNSYGAPAPPPSQGPGYPQPQPQPQQYPPYPLTHPASSQPSYYGAPSPNAAYYPSTTASTLPSSSINYYNPPPPSQQQQPLYPSITSQHQASSTGYPPPPPPPPQQGSAGYFPTPGGQQQPYYQQQQQQPANMAASPYEIYAPSVIPDPQFNAQKDCEALRRAMKGIGTDEGAIIAVLCKRSWQQRSEIERTYKQMFGKDLEREVASETGGHFHQILSRLLKTPAELGAYELHKAIEGAGTDEEALVEIICTKSNEELRAIEIKYVEMFGHSLEREISGDTSGYFRRLLVSLLSCNRPPDYPPDMNAAMADARALYEAGQKRVGTDEVRFNAILCSRSYAQLRAIFDCYAREYRKDIEDVIRSEFSGDIAKALLAVVGVIRNRPAYFASRLHAAMAGAGTQDEMLLRIVVMRCDFDLAAIKHEYLRMYGKPLSKAIQDETSGDYKRALLALIGD